MSLDNIQLTDVVVRDLFKNSLVDLKTDKPASEARAAAFGYLGENGQKIAIIVADPNALYLGDEALQFLMGILNACKLTMADVALLNAEQYPGITYTNIQTELNAEKVLLFGVSAGQLELPLQFPHYQVQSYNKQVYLSAPSLGELEKNVEEKKKLWGALKSIFLN